MKPEKEGERGYKTGPHRDWQKAGRRKLGENENTEQSVKQKETRKEGGEGGRERKGGERMRAKILIVNISGNFLFKTSDLTAKLK